MRGITGKTAFESRSKSAAQNREVIDQKRHDEIIGRLFTFVKKDGPGKRDEKRYESF